MISHVDISPSQEEVVGNVGFPGEETQDDRGSAALPAPPLRLVPLPHGIHSVACYLPHLIHRQSMA